MKDYYKILGVNPFDNEVTIKEAFRKKANEYHPDKNKGNAASEENMKDILEAYRILTNPLSKKNYDDLYHQYYTNKHNLTFPQSKIKEKKEINKKRIINRNILLLCIIGLGVIIVGFISFYDTILYQYEAVKYEKIKENARQAVRHRDISINNVYIQKSNIQTRWDDGYIYYIFNLRIDMESILLSQYDVSMPAGTRLDIKNGISKYITSFTIVFIDAEGFKIKAFSIPLSSMNLLINDDGATIGYERNSKLKMSINDYIRISDWNLLYKL